MTETSYEENFISGCYDFLPNFTIADILIKNMRFVGTPKWTDEDKAFASELSKYINPANILSEARNFTLDEKDYKHGLVTQVFDKYYDRYGYMGASTDVGDVSWQIPVGCFGGAATVMGSTGHTWHYTAACGSGIGTRGACSAAKILALTAYDFITEPNLLEKAKKEHFHSVLGKEYKSPLINK